MEHRRLGPSGSVVSAVSCGNSITQRGQVVEDATIGCAHAALDAGITTLDTAGVGIRPRS
jgi:aryl-alcohol dehydrogenase-like predicted oxidoreductase